MQRSTRFLIPFLCLIFAYLSLDAQAPIRPDDHFFRRRVVNRIDLNEKINLPLIQRSSPIYGGQGQAAGEGIVATLLQGLEEGEYMAYHPDDINRPMSFEEVLARIQEFEADFSGADLSDWGEDEGWSDDEWEEVDSSGTVTSAPSGNLTSFAEVDLGPYEQVIQFVEDRLFDKVRSEMVYHIDHFQLIWSDPGETLPDKVLAVFRYQDVAESLDEVYCHNARFNDAEVRTMKETFELRRFNSYIINISGQGIQTLPEAEQRREALVRIEHEYWSY